MSVEDKVRQNTARVISLEHDVSSLKVDTGRMSLAIEHQEEKQQERFTVLNTSQMEMKDIIRARAEAEDKRADDLLRHREEKERKEEYAERQKQKWVQSLLTPQTLILILAILASVFGVKGLDMMESPAPTPVETTP